MVLDFDLVLRWPLEGLDSRRPWGVWRGGRWAGREGDACVMVVWTLYGRVKVGVTVWDAKIERA